MIRPKAIFQASSILVLTTAMPLVAQAPPNTVFNPVPPCRVVDSRINLGTSGTLLPGQTRNIRFGGTLCGIPGFTNDGGLESNTAVAVAVNVVAANPQGPGHLTAWPSNQPQPTTAIINYTTAHIANGVILPLCDSVGLPGTACAGGDIKFQAAVSRTDLVVDVTGYYVKPTLSGAKRHGTGPGADDSLCLLAEHRFGLSDKLVTFADAPLACPAGTQMCSRLIVSGNPCDTSRADSGCDYRNCEGTCIDQPPTNHFGWVDWDNPSQDLAVVVGEGVGNALEVPTCEYRPVWCCSVG